MRRTLLLLGAGALLAAIWLLVTSSGSEAPPGGVTEGVRIPEPDGGSVLRRGEAEVTDAGFERSEVPRADVGEDRRLSRILVTNKETGEPVAGAEVSWYENFGVAELDDEEREEYRRLSRDLETLTRRYGIHARQWRGQFVYSNCGNIYG